MSKRDGKKWERGTNQRQGVKARVDYSKWPVERAYVPVEEAWRVSGHGAAGVVRRRPDGRMCSSFCHIDLSSGGLTTAYGKDDTTIEEVESLLRDFGDKAPPCEVGPADLAARLVRGAYALSLDAGAEWDAAILSRYVAMFPAIPGTKRWWADDLMTSLIPGKLAVIAEEFWSRKLPPGKEPALAVFMHLEIPDPDALREKLKASPDDFRPIEGEANNFHWIRERTRNPGERVPHGVVSLPGSVVVAHAASLSLASMMVLLLKRLTDGAARLKWVDWRGVDELKLTPPGMMIQPG